MRRQHRVVVHDRRRGIGTMVDTSEIIGFSEPFHGRVWLRIAGTDNGQVDIAVSIEQSSDAEILIDLAQAQELSIARG
jgi:hypothetical protein